MARRARRPVRNTTAYNWNSKWYKEQLKLQKVLGYLERLRRNNLEEPYASTLDYFKEFVRKLMKEGRRDAEGRHGRSYRVPRKAPG